MRKPRKKVKISALNLLVSTQTRVFEMRFDYRAILYFEELQVINDFLYALTRIYDCLMSNFTLE